MMNIKMLKAALAGLVLSVSSLANAGVITFNSVDNGWYAVNGNHSTSNTNTWTGCSTGNSSCTNSFYNFELGNLLNGTAISSAYIKFFSNGTYYSEDSSELVQLWDVTTIPGQGSSTAVYNDLMSGVLYGSTEVPGSFNTSMPEFNITLNSASYNNLINGGFFSLGAHLANISSSEQKIWWGSGALPAAQLFIEYEKVAVPEPSTLAIFALGIMGLASRRFKKK